MSMTLQQHRMDLYEAAECATTLNWSLGESMEPVKLPVIIKYYYRPASKGTCHMEPGPASFEVESIMAGESDLYWTMVDHLAEANQGNLREAYRYIDEVCRKLVEQE